MRLIWIGLVFGLAATPLSGAAFADDYGALAAGISGGHVGVAFTKERPNQGAADASALKECEKITNNCQVVGRFYNGGCGFIASTASGGTCWGSGESPAVAASECKSRGCGACQTPIGGCTNPP